MAEIGEGGSWTGDLLSLDVGGGLEGKIGEVKWWMVRVGELDNLLNLKGDVGTVS